MNKKFTIINNNSIFKKINYIEKAYVEGVYSDSPANRKLGRVGMSYKEYADSISKKETSESKKKNLNEIPENIQDLKFVDKGGRKIASYKFEDSNVEIELVSNIKYQDKKYTMTIKNSKDNITFKGENATEIGKKMKALKNKQLYMSNKPLYKILPLTPEELDAKWGDTGFTYTYFKDNLDIKVWIREDSDKKNPSFNIYVKDVKTKKQKNFTKLSLKETHNKLLDFDLNPNIDKPLSDSQLKEKNRILKEEYGEENISNDDEAYASLEKLDIVHKDKEGNYKINNKPFVINGNKIFLSRDENNNIKANIVRWDSKEGRQIESGREKKVTLKSIKDLFKLINQILKEGTNYNLHNDTDIVPSRDLNIDFDRYGKANFKKGNYATKIIVNPNDKSKLDIISYKIERIENEGEKPYYRTKLLGMDSVSVENFNSKIKDLGLENEINKKNQVDYIQGERDNDTTELKPKDIVEDYSNGELLYTLPGVRFYKWDVNKAKENKEVKKYLNLKKFDSRYEKFNRDKISAISFVKSGEFKNWLDTMPPSKKFTKEQILNKINDKIDRISPHSSDMGLSGDSGVRYDVVKNYF